MVLNGRTDMAAEAHTLWRSGAGSVGELRGVRLSEEELLGLSVTTVEINEDDAAKKLGRSKGRYYSLLLDTHFERGSESFPAAAEAVAELIRRAAGEHRRDSVLIAALGNPDISPDAVGSIAASSILVTRHLKQSGAEQFSAFASTVLCRTGVLGTTGIESARQIAALCSMAKPELVIVVDAMAGADAERLCRTIQVSDSGLEPGSGVGNSREALNSEVLGVPVIAVGAPTVIDAAALSSREELKGMFVTPRGIDSSVRCLGRLIGYGINLALHPGLTVSDVDMLTG